MTSNIQFVYILVFEFKWMPNISMAILMIQGWQMRMFATFDLFKAEVEQTTGFTYDELDAYERSIGFNSFGKIADQRMIELVKEVDKMETTATSPIMAQARITQSLTANTTYLQIIADENGENSCETKYFRSPYRYVMNLERMFKVDTLYFKVFEEGHASCGISHYNDLRNLTDAQFSLLEETDTTFNVFKHASSGRGNYGLYLAKTEISSDGKQKVTVELYYHQHSVIYWEYIMDLDAEFWVRTWGKHKWLGIWWDSHRTYTNNITLWVMVNGTLQSGSDVGSNGGYKRHKKLLSVHNLYSYWPVIYINKSAGYGKIPAVTCYMNFN